MDKVTQNKINELLNNFVNSIKNIFNTNVIIDFIKKKYLASLENAELQLNMNFMTDHDTLGMLEEYVKGNVGNITDEINIGLRQEIQKAILDKVELKELRSRLLERFNSEKYLNRLKMVVRTEGNRAGNSATMDAARQSGLKLYKYLDNPLDDRTSDICIAEMDKYGSKDKAIPLEENFEITVNGKDYISDSPPFHVNCRTVVRLIEIEDVGELNE